MRRVISATIAALGATLAITSVAAAQPTNQPASCAGYLSSGANPNNAWVVQNVVRPLADDLGVTVGELISSTAQRHSGSLVACIP